VLEHHVLLPWGLEGKGKIAVVLEIGVGFPAFTGKYLIP
jgi:hypothetical protein